MSSKFDVFLSRKDQDSGMSKTIYDFLTNHDLKVFDSAISLPEIGISDFRTAIDDAIENSTHMVLIGSSIENISSTWVSSEWKMFENEYRSSNKKGNLLVVLEPGIKPKSLPISLRTKQIIYFDKKNLPILLKYLPKSLNEPNPLILKPKPPVQNHRPFSSRFLLYCGIGLLALFGLGVLYKSLNKKIEFDNNIHLTDLNVYDYLKTTEEYNQKSELLLLGKGEMILKEIDPKTHPNIFWDSLHNAFMEKYKMAENVEISKKWLNLSKLIEEKKYISVKTNSTNPLKQPQKKAAKVLKKTKTQQPYFYKDPELNQK